MAEYSLTVRPKRIEHDESTSDSSFRVIGLAVVAVYSVPYRWNLLTDLHGTKVKIAVVQMHQSFGSKESNMESVPDI
jgi:hypothetical protein